VLRTLFSEKGGSDDRVGKGIWLKLGKEIKVLKGKFTETKILGNDDKKRRFHFDFEGVFAPVLEGIVIR
jgi:hypothetical protein